MVGSNTRREIAEPIYRDMLRQISDEALESEARAWVWLCETTFDGPGLKTFGIGTVSGRNSRGEKGWKSFSMQSNAF
jgi:hypothetical protein